MLVIPAVAAEETHSKILQWRRKLWEWNTAWLGLGLAVAPTIFFTETLKLLTGKPRPDFLDRCDPDLSLRDQFTVSGLGASVEGAPRMLDARICRDQTRYVLKHGFAAWPSGHASISWAGMLYLTLFLCAKFSISIPCILPKSCGDSRDRRYKITDQARDSVGREFFRKQTAAPPVYLLVLAFVPVYVAFFIATSRYVDNRHAGFDIIFGSLIGIFFAWLGFHWYHIPLHVGIGSSWAPRSRSRAFYIAHDSTADAEEGGWASSNAVTRDSATNMQQRSRENSHWRWSHQPPSRNPGQSEVPLPHQIEGDLASEQRGTSAGTELESKNGAMPDNMV